MREQGRQYDIEHRPRRHRAHSPAVPGDHGGDGPVAGAERGEHLRLRPCRDGKAGIWPDHPPGGYAVLPPLREHHRAHAPARPGEGEGGGHPAAGGRDGGAAVHQLGPQRLSRCGLCGSGAGPGAAGQYRHRAGGAAEGLRLM